MEENFTTRSTNRCGIHRDNTSYVSLVVRVKRKGFIPKGEGFSDSISKLAQNKVSFTNEIYNQL